MRSSSAGSLQESLPDREYDGSVECRDITFVGRRLDRGRQNY